MRARAQRYVEMNSTPSLQQYSRSHPDSPARYLHLTAVHWRTPRKETWKDVCQHCSLSLHTKITQLRPIQSKANSKHAYRRVNICIIHTRLVQIRLLSSHSSYPRSACSPQTRSTLMGASSCSPGSSFSVSFPSPFPCPLVRDLRHELPWPVNVA